MNDYLQVIGLLVQILTTWELDSLIRSLETLTSWVMASFWLKALKESGKRQWGGQLNSGMGVVGRMGMNGKFPEINCTLVYGFFCSANQPLLLDSPKSPRVWRGAVKTDPCILHSLFFPTVWQGFLEI